MGEVVAERRSRQGLEIGGHDYPDTEQSIAPEHGTFIGVRTKGAAASDEAWTCVDEGRLQADGEVVRR